MKQHMEDSDLAAKVMEQHKNRGHIINKKKKTNTRNLYRGYTRSILEPAGAVP